MPCRQSPFAFATQQMNEIESWFPTDQTDWMGREYLLFSLSSFSKLYSSNTTEDSNGTKSLSNVGCGLGDDQLVSRGKESCLTITITFSSFPAFVLGLLWREAIVRRQM